MLHRIEEYRSQYGLFTLVVGRDDGGDVCVGFDGYPWHTHAEILAPISGFEEDQAVRAFVDDRVGDKSIIAIARVDGKIRDVWIAEVPVPDQYKPDDETIEFRFWSGKPDI